ncbi:hypothetical protein GG344DRAFT_82168 [Lentinula edodes]|nr:hypothetical protein GG344DRAFT_82168 [Lentinula edodes]
MTTSGTSTAAATVIHTVPRQRTDNPGILTTVYKQLEITADCDRFNRWSPPAPPLHAHGLWDNGPATTLVDILKNIVNLQSALRDYAPANPTLDVTVTIDSPVSYILAILDYLQLQGMLMKYDRPVVKELLDGMISTQKQDVPPVVTSSSLTLSWGFRFFTGTAAAKPQQGRDRSRWMTLTDPMLSVGKTFLCFGTLHCFGLGDGDGGMVKDIQPRTRQANLEQHFHFIMGNHAIYPSFDLQKFEESLKASVFLLKLTGHFRPPVRFADISSEEIQKESGLSKTPAEDHDTFYFRVLLEYMAANGIIGNYNTETYNNMIKALGLARAAKPDVAVGSELIGELAPVVGTSSTHPGVAQAPTAHSSHSANSQVGSAGNYLPRISVVSLLQNATEDPSNGNLVHHM